MTEENIIDLLWEVKEGITHPNKAYKRLVKYTNIVSDLPSEEEALEVIHFRLMGSSPEKLEGWMACYEWMKLEINDKIL